MGRLPTLSPTKFTTFLACPTRYRWTYVDGRGKWYLKSKSYYSFGTTLHRVLERFHDANDAGVTCTEEAMAAYEENWIDAGFTSAEEMMEAFGEGKEILDKHVAFESKRPKLARTLFVEQPFSHVMSGFKLIGRIDRIDEREEDGALEIIDYKSGRSSVSESDVANDIAMGIYQLLVKRSHPDKRVVATIVALRSGATATYSMSETELSEFEQDIQVLGTRILEEDYHSLEPVFKAMCPNCDFLPLCRRNDEFGEHLTLRLA